MSGTDEPLHQLWVVRDDVKPVLGIEGRAKAGLGQGGCVAAGPWCSLCIVRAVGTLQKGRHRPTRIGPAREAGYGDEVGLQCPRSSLVPSHYSGVEWG